MGAASSDTKKIIVPANAEVIPVSPIGSSSRGWMNIAFTVSGIALAIVQSHAVSDKYPWAGGAALVLSGVTNWLALHQSKKDITAKIKVPSGG